MGQEREERASTPYREEKRIFDFLSMIYFLFDLFVFVFVVVLFPPQFARILSFCLFLSWNCYLPTERSGLVLLVFRDRAFFSFFWAFPSDSFECLLLCAPFRVGR